MKDHRKKLPIGIDSFEKLRANEYYYVDKTGLIADLLDNLSEVTLYTRPRRFGKSLNMSMLESFFSPGSDKRIFAGLKISGEETLCEQYMGQYPVISISLKGLDGGSYATTFRQAIRLINREAGKVYRQVRDGNKLLPEEMEKLYVLRQADMDESTLFDSLYTLSEILEKHYDRKVILLIDEYDVPLAKAYENGYYEPMILLIRNLFQAALKTNEHLQFAVLTGCMRISKESIFTGLNNLKVLGIADARSDEYFGFTDAEVRELLAYYDLSDRYDTAREWYDGYRFGNVNVYCPWDVINYCDTLRWDPEAEPENYWINSSGNSIIRTLIEHSSNASTRDDIEALINGETVEKVIRQDLTYPEIYNSIENIWSVLYTTGYLTLNGRRNGEYFPLIIPNLEVRSIFAGQILTMFRESVKDDKDSLTRLCKEMQEGQVSGIEESLNEYLSRTISIRDTAVRKAMKENFYHGLLVGLLSARDQWAVRSNSEAGEGYSDITVRDRGRRLAMVIEVKYADDGDMDAVCRRALEQIEEKHYAEGLYDDGFDHILKYGIAFYKKGCRVMVRGDTAVISECAGFEGA